MGSDVCSSYLARPTYVPRRESDSIMPHYRGFKKFLIGSQWVDPHGIIDHVVSNPANGEEIGVVRLADDLDIDRAVAAARGAWENRVWSDLTLEQRAEKVDRKSTRLNSSH